MRRAAALLLVVLALAGCKCQSIDGDYGPLTKICERPKLPYGSNTAYTTLGAHIYTTSLDTFNEDYPPGSPDLEALLRHERVHAKRQFHYQGMPGEIALWAWVARYVTDAKFMWREEQLGYYESIRHLQANGLWHNARTYAQAEAMHDTYKTIGGKHMVSFDDAVAWITDVLNGVWTPPQD